MGIGAIAGAIQAGIGIYDDQVNPTPNIRKHYQETEYTYETKLAYVDFAGIYNERQIAKGIEAAIKECTIKNIEFQRKEKIVYIKANCM